MVAFTVVACEEGGGDKSVAVWNRTQFQLHFSVLLDTSWYRPPAQLMPGESTVVIGEFDMWPDKCTAGGMIAYAEDGREIARHDAPLCGGDRWVIDITSPTSTPMPSSGG